MVRKRQRPAMSRPAGSGPGRTEGLKRSDARSGSTQHEVRMVPRIDVRELAGSGVKVGDEEGDKFCEGDIMSLLNDCEVFIQKVVPTFS
ncbi:MAG TPA: hypothetical protein VJB38_09065 [Bacteroidota bacterium]|nr:hypothetical protein [Bacteroidota bacterium]